LSAAKIEVDLASTRLAGFTDWTADSNGPPRGRLKVDPDLFFAEYFSIVK